LFVKNLVWESSNRETLCATWENITHAYETDNCSGDLRAVPKLTNCHIYADKLKKMKVSHAAQVISHSLASFINILSKMSSEKNKAESLLGTAKILKFFDCMFDSVNASTPANKSGKKFKCAATLNSDVKQRVLS
jgi:hypothetical protein